MKSKKDYLMNKDFQILHGDALTVLRGMESESVQCAITSPPYYGLRSYKTVPQIWGNHNGCDHAFGETMRNPKADPRSAELKRSQGANIGGTITYNADTANGTSGNFCLSCNSWRGELGLEPTFDGPNGYIAHLIEIFAEVKRVLKKDGICVVNLGDSYAGDSPVRSKTSEVFSKSWDANQTASRGGPRRSAKFNVVRPKSLMNIPHRFAIAMTDELQFVQRNECIWYKRACMPSSATDRFTVNFEPIFMFAKNGKYKFNQQLEDFADERMGNPSGGVRKYGGEDRNDVGRELAWNENGEIKGRNKRTVMDVPFEPSSDSHYASYPTKLIEPFILAGTDEGDTVLDIFNGTATTGVTAIRHHRKYIGIELNQEYIEISKRRLREVQPVLLGL